MQDDPPPTAVKLRMPRESLAGCIWLPRFIDKVRCHLSGTLPADYAAFLGHPRGVDGHFLSHFGLEKESAICAIEQRPREVDALSWFLAQPGVSGERIDAWNTQAPDLGRPGHPGERELRIVAKRFFGSSLEQLGVTSVFEAIELDEGSSKSVP